MIPKGPKKYWQDQDLFKVMFIVACDFDGVLVTHSVPPGNRANSAFNSYFQNTIYDQSCTINVQIT